MVALNLNDPAVLEQVAKKIYGTHQTLHLEPYILGVFFDALLTGIVICQLSVWWSGGFKHDSWVIQVLGTWVVAGGLTYTVVQLIRVIKIFCTGFGWYTGLLDQSLGKALVAILLLVHFPCQMFYIHRSYLLSGKSDILRSLFAVLLAVSFGLFIASLLHFPDLSLEWGKTEVRLFVSLASSVFALDWLITLSIILMLWRRRSGQPAQDRLVKRLVLLSAETQLPSSLFAMVICITDATGYLFLSPIFEALMCKTSIITLLAVLISRRRIRREMLAPSLPTVSVDAELLAQEAPLEAIPALAYAETDLRLDLAHLTPDAQVALPGLQQSHSIGTQSSSELGLESPLTSIDTPDSGVPFFQGFVKGA